jgi:hypothetical protein
MLKQQLQKKAMDIISVEMKKKKKVNSTQKKLNDFL